MNNSNEKNRKIAILGILGSLALVLSFTENLIMPQTNFLPLGAKPGLSNIVIMFVTDTMGLFSGLYIVLLKALFAFITRGATAGIMSFSGGFLSLIVVWILLKINSKNISMTGIGVLSSCSHNVGQLLTSCILTGTPTLMNYLPFLLLFGVVTGLITGLILQVVMPKISQIKQ